MKISDPSFYALKDGVNLRFFFQSPRYSEDMDIDVFGGSVETLKKNGYKILEDASFRRSIQAYGIEDLIINDPAKAKQTETTQRFRLRLVNDAGEEFPAKVEFSRRSKASKTSFIQEVIPPDVALPYKRLSYSCQHYHGEFATVQKVHALGGRIEVQARDVFDLYILYLGGHLLKERIHQHVSKSDREKACLALISLDYPAYQGQVVEYLEPKAKARFAGKTVWNSLCKTVLESVE